MTVEELLQQIEEGLASLNAGGAPAPAASTVLERLRTKYRADLSAALQKLVVDIKENPAQCVQLAQAFLANLWMLIKGTALDYTATHDLDEHGVVFTIAQGLAELQNQAEEDPTAHKHPIECLMPGIQIEVLDSKYPSWHPVGWTAEDKRHYTRLRRLGKKGQTASDKALLLQLETKKVVYDNELQLAVFHKQDGDFFYPAVPLANILSTHILSEDGQTLIPASVLSQSTKQAYRPYGEEEGYEPISEGEWQRLYGLNYDTKNLHRLMQQFAKIEADKSHLWGMLTDFCNVLEMADAHTGIGQQGAVGVQAYPALHRMQAFYQKLEKSQKAEIPERLRKEIEHTLALAFDPEFNRKYARKVEEGCFGKRKENLRDFMAGHEAVLVKIGISEAHKAQLVEELKRNIQSLQDTIRVLVEKRVFAGEDRLPVTEQLFQSLGVSPIIAHDAELDQLMYDCGPDALKSILSLPGNSQKVATFFLTGTNVMGVRTLYKNEFVGFVLNHSLEKLELFFSVAGAELLKHVTIAQIRGFKGVLPAEKFHALVAAKILQKGQSIFGYACRTNNADLARLAIEHYGEDINQMRGEGYVVLSAMDHSNVDVLRYILSLEHLEAEVIDRLLNKAFEMVNSCYSEGDALKVSLKNELDCLLLVLKSGRFDVDHFDDVLLKKMIYLSIRNGLKDLRGVLSEIFDEKYKAVATEWPCRLLDAVIEGSWSTVEKILQTHPDCLQTFRMDGKHLLEYACHNYEVHLVEAVLKQPAADKGIDQQSVLQAFQALWFLVRGGCIGSMGAADGLSFLRRMVDLLFENGWVNPATIDARVLCDFLVLVLNDAGIEYIKEKMAYWKGSCGLPASVAVSVTDLVFKFKGHGSLLRFAIEQNDVGLAQRAVTEYGEDLNARGAHGLHHFSVAIRHPGKREEMVRWLLDQPSLLPSVIKDEIQEHIHVLVSSHSDGALNMVWFEHMMRLIEWCSPDLLEQLFEIDGQLCRLDCLAFRLENIPMLELLYKKMPGWLNTEITGMDVGRINGVKLPAFPLVAAIQDREADERSVGAGFFEMLLAWPGINVHKVDRGTFLCPLHAIKWSSTLAVLVGSDAFKSGDTLSSHKPIAFNAKYFENYSVKDSLAMVGDLILRGYQLIWHNIFKQRNLNEIARSAPTQWFVDLYERLPIKLLCEKTVGPFWTTCEIPYFAADLRYVKDPAKVLKIAQLYRSAIEYKDHGNDALLFIRHAARHVDSGFIREWSLQLLSKFFEEEYFASRSQISAYMLAEQLEVSDIVSLMQRKDFLQHFERTRVLLERFFLHQGELDKGCPRLKALMQQAPNHTALPKLIASLQQSMQLKLSQLNHADSFFLLLPSDKREAITAAENKLMRWIDVHYQENQHQHTAKVALFTGAKAGMVQLSACKTLEEKLQLLLERALKYPKKQGASYKMVSLIVDVVVGNEHCDARSELMPLPFQILRYRYYQIMMSRVHYLGLNKYDHAGPEGGRADIIPEVGFRGQSAYIWWGDNTSLNQAVPAAARGFEHTSGSTAGLGGGGASK